MIYENQHPEGAETYLISKHGNPRLGPHFLLSEFACKDGSDLVIVHPMQVALLETIRAHFGRPIIINSGFRTKSHNAAVGGSPGSKHLLGMADDIRIKYVSPLKLYEYVDSLGVGGAGLYKTFVHVDVAGQGRRWKQ